MRNEEMFVLLTEGNKVKYVPANCRNVNVNSEDYLEDDKKTGRQLPKRKIVKTLECDLVPSEEDIKEQDKRELLAKQRERDKVKRKEREVNPLKAVEDEFRSISRGIYEKEDEKPSKEEKKKYRLVIKKKDRIESKASEEASDTKEDELDELNLNGQIYFDEKGRWTNPDKKRGSLSYPKGRGSQYSRGVGKARGTKREPCGTRDRKRTCKTD
jgi:hypothetical protein